MKEKLEHIQSRNINIFLIGYVLYSFAFVLNRVNPPYMIILANELLSLIGLGMVVFALFSSIRFKKTTTGYVKILLAFLFIWFYILAAWSLKLDYAFIKLMLFSGESALPAYLVPLVVFIPKKLLLLKRTIIAVAILACVFFVFVVLFQDKVFTIYGSESVDNDRYIFEYFAKWLSIGSGFLLLTFSYNSKKVRVIAIGVIITTLLIAVFRARRALIFMSFLPMMIATIIYVFKSRYKLIAIMAAFLVSFGVLILSIELYNTNKGGFFDNITTRIDEDTRGGVEDCLINDFRLRDWIFGRGFDGAYFCPNIDNNYQVVGYRKVIETDYLNIILKNGSIYLILLLLLLIPAIFKGLFQSRNVLSKAAASWILFWVLCLYPANVFAFSINYLLVWLSAGICYSKKIREIPDIALKEYFLNKGEDDEDGIILTNQNHFEQNGFTKGLDS